MEQIADLIKAEMKSVEEDIQELLKQNKKMRMELKELKEELMEDKKREMEGREKSARKQNIRDGGETGTYGGVERENDSARENGRKQREEGKEE